MKRHSVINIAVSAVRQCFRGVLRSILDGAYEARCRDIHRDIERVIGRSDGYLTDEVERRITQHLMRNSSFLAKRHSTDAMRDF